MRSLLILFAVVGVAVARPGFLGLGYGARSLIHAPAAYSHVVSPVAYTSVVAAPAPVAVSSQYHAQDELGQYSYGYAGGPSAKSEVKSWDGVTRGGYSYVDAEGKVQNVNYVADAVNGFRVAATNLPVAPEAIPAEPLVAPVPVEDTPEVVAAKEAHFALYAEAKAAAEAAPEEPEPAADEPAAAAEEPAAAPVASTPADTLPASVLSRDVTYPAYTYGAYIPASYPAVAPVSYSYSAVAPVVAPVSYKAPVVPYSNFAYSSVAPAYYAAPWAHSGYSYTAVAPVAAPAVAPVAAPAPITYAVPHVASSQYHAQDEIGQYSYGYAGGPSAKSEVKSWDGVTRGGYSYVDAEGKLQTVNYVADPINGFRVAATNLPVAPVAPEAPILETIADTPEVAAAKAEHLAAVEEAKNRSAE